MKRAAPWFLPALAAAAVAPFLRGDGGDTWLFVRAGRTLLSSHWSHAFADPATQVGPLQLALYGSVGRSPALLAAVLGAAVTLLAQAAARAAGASSPRALILVGVGTILTGLSTNAFEAGHPADTMLPLLWVLAAADARRGRTIRAAAIVALGAGLETWGILGLAVLALAPRRSPRALAVAGCVVAALFLPFVLAGDFAMLSFDWKVSPHSPLALVLAPGTPFGWPLRLVQGAVAVGGGVLLARTARRSVHVVWLVPAAVVGLRLLLDPVLNDYYFAGLVGPALVGLASFGVSRGFALMRSAPSAT